MTSSIKIDAIVAAAQGCSHAVAVIESVRDQLQSGEVLFIMEGQECGLSDTVLSSGVRMRHVATDMLHDFDLTAAGIELAAGRAEQADVLLVLEDHGVPDPGFIENLREFFVDERRQGSTFYLRNGSPFNASSRALFAYVGGLADIEGKNKPIEPVTSSFAIRL